MKNGPAFSRAELTYFLLQQKQKHTVTCQQLFDIGDVLLVLRRVLSASEQMVLRFSNLQFLVWKSLDGIARVRIL